MSDTPVVLKIDSAIFSVRYVQLLPAIANDLNQSIARSPAKFPLRRAEVKTFTIGTGLLSKIEDHLFQGQLPKRVFIGMISNEAFNGSFDTNSFNFTHFDLSKLEVTCYRHNVYGKFFEPNFDDDLYLRSYLSLFQALNSPTQMQNCNIDIEDYKSGYCLWGFDFTPDQGADQGHLHPMRLGNLRIELQFTKSLPATVNVIVYAEFDNLIEINELREVVTDY